MWLKELTVTQVGACKADYNRILVGQSRKNGNAAGCEKTRRQEWRRFGDKKSKAVDRAKYCVAAPLLKNWQWKCVIQNKEMINESSKESQTKKEKKTNVKETPGQNKLFFIDCQWLVKTNCATFIFIGKLGNKYCLASFGPASLSVPSSMLLSPDLSSCGPKLMPLYCCDMKLCGDGVGRYGLNGSHQLL